MEIIKNKKIMIISPHPDDEAICCGGLIMLAKKLKSEVFVLYMAIGSSRQLQTGKTTTNSRMPEMKNASKYGGFKYKLVFEGHPFMRLDSLPQKDIIEAIEDNIKMYKPSIVCIPYRHSFDQDHRAVSTACITALRPIPTHLSHQAEIILEYEEPYTWSTEGGFRPNFFIDISTVINKKIQLLKKHKTQLRKDPFPRSPENLIRLAGMRGCDSSTKYAEGYNLIKGSFK